MCLSQFCNSHKSSHYFTLNFDLESQMAQHRFWLLPTQFNFNAKMSLTGCCHSDRQVARMRLQVDVTNSWASRGSQQRQRTCKTDRRCPSRDHTSTPFPLTHLSQCIAFIAISDDMFVSKASRRPNNRRFTCIASFIHCSLTWTKRVSQAHCKRIAMHRTRSSAAVLLAKLQAMMPTFGNRYSSCTLKQKLVRYHATNCIHCLYTLYIKYSLFLLSLLWVTLTDLEHTVILTNNSI